MSSWLQKQRKADLVELADEAGLTGSNSMKKEDLAHALDAHLKSNATTLGNKKALSEYYNRATTPAKKDAATDGEKKPKARRATKSPTEIAESAEAAAESAKTAISRTPKAVQKVVSRVPLPPSPSAVTNLVERQTAIVTRRVNKYFQSAGLTGHLQTIRASLSTVVGVETTVLLFEAYGLQRVTLPWRYAFALPGNKIVRTDPFAIHFPDFFVLLTSSFWAPSTLWVFTSLLLPLLAAWFFNLTLHNTKKERKGADPLMFNIVKGLLTWLVYAKGVRFGGMVSNLTVRNVDAAVYGGYQGMLIGAGIGAVVSVYEAVMKK